MIRWPRRLWFASSLTLGLAVLGCGGAEDNLPRQAVSGKVALDGKPLARGAINFTPEGQGQANPVAVGAVIIDGAYSISKAEGPTPGTYGVSILASDEGPALASGEAPGAPPKKTQKAVIPAKYNAQSTLKAEVKAGGSNTFDYDLSSK